MPDINNLKKAFLLVSLRKYTVHGGGGEAWQQNCEVSSQDICPRTQSKKYLQLVPGSQEVPWVGESSFLSHTSRGTLSERHIGDSKSCQAESEDELL